jgi:hypothetical protein
MITGTLKSQIDRIWETFWTGGITNPLSVIEQITYLLFIKGLDEAISSLIRQKAHFDNTMGLKTPILSIGIACLRGILTTTHIPWSWQIHHLRDLWIMSRFQTISWR